MTNIKRADLTDEQALLEVVDYHEHNDSFHCLVQTRTGQFPIGQECIIPAVLLPTLTGEYGEPDEFIGRTFLIGPK